MTLLVWAASWPGGDRASGPLIPAAGCNEPFAAWSHFLGAAVFLVLGAMLLHRGRGDRLRVTSLAIYAVCCVAVFTASGLFHLPPRTTPWHAIAGRIDHAAIFFQIAGTYTPSHIIIFRGWWRWAPLAIVWVAAIAGAVMKTIFFESISHDVGIGLYLTLGWVGIFGAIAAWRRYGWEFIAPLMLGAVALTVGALIECQGQERIVLVPGYIHAHEIWHVAVLVGLTLHWVFIYQFANGALPPRRDQPNAWLPRPSQAN